MQPTEDAEKLYACSESAFHPQALAQAGKAVHSTPVARLAELFAMLGDPTRAGILTALSACELCVCDLAELFKLTPSAVSHQLRLLRAHRLVKFRREGKMVIYSLDDAHVAGLIALGAEHLGEGRK